MKTYAIVIQPRSPFGTSLKGDTIFGQFCWQIAHDPGLLECSFEEVVKTYPERPFAIFSSAFPWLGERKWCFKRPDVPMALFSDISSLDDKLRIEKRKELKKKRWVICDRPGVMESFKSVQLVTDSELLSHAKLGGDHFVIVSETNHNSINRLTGTTGEGHSPFTQENIVYQQGGLLVIFAGIDHTVMTVEKLKIALEHIGIFGFGRDASTGKGRFSVEDIQEIDLFAYGAKEPNALYTLGPSVPEPGKYRDALFTPFTRFGRHGDQLAISGKPYKNPVIMADEGGVFFPQDISESLKTPYLGTGLTGLSKILPETIAQGYSLYIPARMEVTAWA